MTDRNPAHLCPELQAIARQWLSSCQIAGLTARINVTWRNPTDQDKAYAAGLSNAKAGQSPHNITLRDGTPYSMAFDFALFDNGKYITDGEDDRYKRAGVIGKDLGLAWGGDWHRPDWDHLEMSDWKTKPLPDSCDESGVS